MSIPADLLKNHLLAALPDNELRRIFPHLEEFPMRPGDTLHRPGERLRHAFFPATAIVSLIYLMGSGVSAEIASVGNEGLLGITLFMGGDTTTNSAVVQTGGLGYRLKAELLQEEFNRCGTTQRLLLRYTQALGVQIGQTASCNRHHTIEQQLCRWLLSTLDRLPSNEIIVTHELLAGILGVRRESVTTAAGKLQRAGVLHCRRGHMGVVERGGLEAAACECYRVVRHEYLRLRADLPRVLPTVHHGRARGIDSQPGFQ